MGWESLGSWGSNLFSGGSGNFGDSGGGFDWGSVWGDIGQSGGTYSQYADLLSGGSDGNSSSSGWGSIINSLFGGSSNGQSSNGNVWGALLSGLGGAADAYMGSKMDEKTMREKGKQDRQTIGYGAEIQDYYKQLDKQRKRVALDTYGQFSLLDRNTGVAPAVQVPAKPLAGG